MTMTMSRKAMNGWTEAGRALGLTAAALLLLASAVHAQMPQPGPSRWKLGAATGAYVPFSALIKVADRDDTELSAGPFFSLEPQYLASRYVAAYANGMLSFGTIRLGSAIQPAVVGPSHQAMLGTATAGVVLTTGSPGDWIQPTLRAGGGFKWYSFDLTGATDQVRPTADIGLGFRGIGTGGIEVTGEVRYLLSSFDQSKLPTRGIAPQDQLQNDLVFSVGVWIRPRAGSGP